MNVNKINGYSAIRNALFKTLVKAQNGKPHGNRFIKTSMAITNACMLAADGFIDDVELIESVMMVAPYLNRQTVNSIVNAA